MGSDHEEAFREFIVRSRGGLSDSEAAAVGIFMDEEFKSFLREVLSGWLGSDGVIEEFSGIVNGGDGSGNHLIRADVSELGLSKIYIDNVHVGFHATEAAQARILEQQLLDELPKSTIKGSAGRL